MFKAFKCIQGIFESYDYNNIPIKKELLDKHKNKDSVWITIDLVVYSIPKNDKELLYIFKDYYGLDVKNYLLNQYIFTNHNKINILEKLKKRKIGILTN